MQAQPPAASQKAASPPVTAPAAQAGIPAGAGSPHESRRRAPKSERYTDIPNSQIRKIIASRLLQSKQGVPHAYARADVELGPLSILRSSLKEQGIKVGAPPLKERPSSCMRATVAIASYFSQLIERHQNVRLQVARHQVVRHQNVGRQVVRHQSAGHQVVRHHNVRRASGIIFPVLVRCSGLPLQSEVPGETLGRNGPQRTLILLVEAVVAFANGATHQAEAASFKKRKSWCGMIQTKVFVPHVTSNPGLAYAGATQWSRSPVRKPLVSLHLFTLRPITVPLRIFVAGFRFFLSTLLSTASILRFLEVSKEQASSMSFCGSIRFASGAGMLFKVDVFMCILPCIILRGMFSDSITPE